MHKILLIGAGQLGSRHLQGITCGKKQYSVDVVDPSSNSLEIARQRFEEMESTTCTSQYFTAIPEGKEYDVAIIATNSLVRSVVTRELIEKCTVHRIVFEKILFPTVAEYQEMEEVLAELNIPAWINCPRRMYPVYDELRPLFNGKKMAFVVSGGLWGMACNALHFIDIASFLSGEEYFEYNIDSLDPVVHESKREGYIEFTGTLTATSDSGSVLAISSLESVPELPCLIHIRSDDLRVVLDENSGTGLLYKKENGWQTERISFSIFYQSQLTGQVLDDLIDSNSCQLTSFVSSCRHHLPLLEAFIAHQNKFSAPSKLCPVT